MAEINNKEAGQIFDRERIIWKRAVIVAQLVLWLLPTPEVGGSIPIIGKIYIEQCLLSTVIKKRGRESFELNVLHI